MIAILFASCQRGPADLVNKSLAGKSNGENLCIAPVKLFAKGLSDADYPYDNAHMESFFSRFKAELLESGAFQDAEDSRSEIFKYIEMYYNPKRLHSSICYLSPNAYEIKK